MFKFEEGIFVLMLLVSMVGWYFYWIKPHDELRGRITQCMSDTTDELHHSQRQDYDSLSIYKFCHDKVIQ